MTDLLWLTDVHFNFLKPGKTELFGTLLAAENPYCDGVIISGDIAEAPSVVRLLKEFMEGWRRSVYFVLGNHDYYGGSISQVDESIRALCKEDLRFAWLDEELVGRKAGYSIVGAGGWYDGRCGDARGSRVVMSDFLIIADLKQHWPGEQSWLWYSECRDGLLEKLRSLAAEAAFAGRVALEQAAKVNKHIVFVTHYPPFMQACWHEGKISDAEWQPWFTCAAMGDMLLDFATEHPEHKIVVLCGHTHSSGVFQPAANLKVVTGAAKYGFPGVCGAIGEKSFEW